MPTLKLGVATLLAFLTLQNTVYAFDISKPKISDNKFKQITKTLKTSRFIPDIPPETQSHRYRVYIIDEAGTRRHYFNNALFMPDPSKDGELTDVSKIRFRSNGKLDMKTVPLNTGTDTGYLHLDGKAISKFILNKFKQPIGLFTVSEGSVSLASIDLDADMIIDYQEMYNYQLDQMVVFVMEKAKSLKFYDDLLNGHNAFCSLSKKVSDPSLAGNSFGVGTSEQASYLGCDKKPGLKGKGVHLDNTRKTVNRFCATVLKRSGSCKSIDSAVTRSTNAELGKAIEILDNLIAVYEFIATAGGVIGAGYTLSAPVTAEMIVSSTGMPFWAPGLVLVHTRLQATALKQQFQAIRDDLARQLRFNERQEAIAEENRQNRENQSGGQSSTNSESSSPIPGSARSASMSCFCESKLAESESWNLSRFDEMLAEQECSNPLENQGGIVASPGPKPKPKPSGPFVPFKPSARINNRNCTKVEQYKDLHAMLRDFQDNQCSSTASPGPDSRCGNHGVLGSGNRGKLNVGYGDVMSPNHVNKWLKIHLPKVINPGIKLNIPDRK